MIVLSIFILTVSVGFACMKRFNEWWYLWPIVKQRKLISTSFLKPLYKKIQILPFSNSFFNIFWVGWSCHWEENCSRAMMFHVLRISSYGRSVRSMRLCILSTQLSFVWPLPLHVRILVVTSFYREAIVSWLGLECRNKIWERKIMIFMCIAWSYADMY